MNNAAYLDSDWFRNPLDKFTIRDHVLKLKDFNISTQIVDIGLIDNQGNLFSGNYEHLSNWINTSREVDPTQKIVICLGYGNRKVNSLANPTFGTAKFNNKLNDTLSIFTNVCDGIHLDIEQFLDNDQRLLDTIRHLKYNAAAHIKLSLATPANVWSQAFIKQVAAEVEELYPMIYDAMGWGSSVTDEATYRTFYQNVLQKYVAAVGDLCDIIPIFPAYETKTAGTVIYHDPMVETLAAAAQATKAVNAKSIKGAAIFWWPHFAGNNPGVYHLSARDQEAWKTLWLM